MRTIGNVLWLVLSGFWLAMSYGVAGIVLCLTIIGFPLGLQSLKLAGYALWPFGRVVVTDPSANAAVGCVGNVLWFVLAGWWLVLGHVVTGIALCLSIIGIPLGIANFKLALLALFPFGKTVVALDQIAGRDVWMRGPQPIG